MLSNVLKIKRKKQKKEKITKDVDTKLNEEIKNKKIKAMFDFEESGCNSIKSIAIKGNMNIDVASRFIKGKMLMFTKVLIRSFVYDLIDVFCFPTKEVRRIYDLYSIIKCHLYLNLTDTNSCSIFFNFICKKECNIIESESRKLIFQILKQLKFPKRRDLSDKF